MYSPAAFPSKTRAAPAKNLTWSTLGGSSSDAVSPIGLPVFSLSTATSSSARASIASAIRSNARCRSLGVVSRQVSKALAAALAARSTSAASDTGAVAKTSPVAGLTRSDVRPEAGSTHSLLMKFLSVLSSPTRPPDWTRPTGSRGTFPNGTLVRKATHVESLHEGISFKSRLIPRIHLLLGPQTGQDATHGTSWIRKPSITRRRLQGDHRAASARRSATLRHDRPRSRAVGGSRSPAGAKAAGRGRHADRGGHGPAPG